MSKNQLLMSFFVEDKPSVRFRKHQDGLVVEWEQLTLYFSPVAVVAMVSEIKDVLQKTED